MATWPYLVNYIVLLLPYAYNRLRSSWKQFWRVSVRIFAHPAKRTFWGQVLILDEKIWLSRTMPLTKYGHIRSMMSYWNDGDIIDLRWLHGHIWSMTLSYCPPCSLMAIITSALLRRDFGGCLRECVPIQLKEHLLGQFQILDEIWLTRCSARQVIVWIWSY